MSVDNGSSQSRNAHTKQATNQPAKQASHRMSAQALIATHTHMRAPHNKVRFVSRIKRNFLHTHTLASQERGGWLGR